ncbi:MAG: hypothetical protein HFI66_09230 [Lachnospiraceae bacterium]|nr:hypothetical protein [Lachnospiraceae bacterium]
MNEELWYCVMSICFVLTMTATVIECGVRGIGIGLVRFIAGTALGLVAGGSVILFFGFLLVGGVIIHAAHSTSKSITIIVNSRPVRLTPGSRSDLYLDPKGNTYRRMPNGTVIRDRDGETYEIINEDA